MKKLRSIALYALVPPAIALGTGSLLADETADQDAGIEQQSTQSDQEVTKSSDSTDQGEEFDKGKGFNEDTQSSDTQSSVTADTDVGEANEKEVLDKGKGFNEDTQSSGTQSSVTADTDVGEANEKEVLDKGKGFNEDTQSSTMTTQSDQNTGDLIGSEVKTSGDEVVGSVSDLIVDENGQVTAIVVGVGGFLGMGERDVAIDWDEVTRSGDSGEQELRIDMTREELSSAPKFERKD